MSFDSFKDKPSSQKVTLVEIDVGVNQQTWINKEAGIWAFQYTPDASKIYDGSLGYGDTEDDTYNTAIYKIGSVKIDGEVYIEVDDIASLRTNNASFYYDSSTTFIYIRFDNWNPPEIYSSISLGITSAYANQQIDLDGFTYYARVKGIPNISKKKDALFFGVIQYTGGNITLDNTDGEFGTFIHKDIFSQETRVLFGGDTLTRDDYREGFTGYLEDFDISSGSFTININDKRKFLSRKIPTTYFDSTTYPNIKDNLIGKSIPLAYGELRNISVNCVDDGDTGDSVRTFKICDTTYHSIKSIDKVYVDDIEVSTGDTDLNNATFTITNTGDSENDTWYKSSKKVSANINGYVASGDTLIENPLLIIEDILSNYLSITYNEYNYNQTEWAIAKALVKDVVLFIDKEKDIIKIIEDICNTAYGIFEVKDDGLFTFKIHNTGDTSVKTITVGEMLSPPKVEYKSEEFLTSVAVKYNKDWKNKEYSTYIDTSRQTVIFSKYKIYRQKEFETLLTNETDAIAFASAILDKTESIVPTYTITTKTQNIDLELEDNVDIELYSLSDGTYGTAKCEVIGINKNFTNNTITITARYISSDVDVDVANMIKWKATSSYSEGAVVSYGGNLWRGLAPSVDEPPTYDSGFWDSFVGDTGDTGVKGDTGAQGDTGEKGDTGQAEFDWDSGDTYYYQSIIAYDGILYRGLQTTTGDTPAGDTGDSYWARMAGRIFISGDTPGDTGVNGDIWYQYE